MKIKIWFLAISTVFFSYTGKTQSFVEGFDNISSLNDWYIQNNSDSQDQDWAAGNTNNFIAQTGAPDSYFSVGNNSTNSNSTATISNWLFTPTRTFNNGDIITFYSKTVLSSPMFPDRLEVRMSQAGNSLDVGNSSTSVGDFTNVLLTINPNLTNIDYPTNWTQYIITISGLSGPTNGRIAFRYFVTDGGINGINSNYIGIDTYTYYSVAASPTNDDCTGAISINQGSSCVSTAGTVAYATETVSGCNGSANDDVWYSFSATSNSAAISVNGSNQFDAVYQLFTGNCGNLISLDCVDATSLGESENSIVHNLNAGQTYYIRVFDWTNTIPNTMNFSICVSEFSQCSLNAPSYAILENESCGSEINGGCTSYPTAFMTLNCGNTVFGNCWANTGSRDLDWYKFNIVTPGTVTWGGTAEFPFILYLLDISDCMVPEVLASQSFNACQNGTISYDFQTSGQYACVIGPSTYNSYSCATSNDYIASLYLPSITPTISSNHSGICPNGNVDLTCSETIGSFQWFYNGNPLGASNSINVNNSGNYYVNYTNSNNCTLSSAVFLLQDFQLDDASFNYISDSVCAAINSISPTISNTGVFTVDNPSLIFSDPQLGTIDVASSAVGNYLISFTSNGNCPNSSSQAFVIYSTPNAEFTYADNEFCNNELVQVPVIALGSISGVFNSFPNGLQIDSITGEVFTNQSSNGLYTIYNTLNSSASCPSIIDSFQINIIGPEITFPSIGNICEGSELIILTAQPAGGTFSGIGVSSSLFDPSQVTDSTKIYYQVSDGSCTSIDSQTVVIRPLPIVNIGSDIETCSNDLPILLNIGMPAGGTYFYNGNEVSSFDPSMSNLGANSITYFYSDMYNCQNSDSMIIFVKESPIVTFDPLSSVCDTISELILMNGNPNGGIYTGPSVTNGIFYPSIAGQGSHTISYTYSENGCTTTVDQNIFIEDCLGLFEIQNNILVYPNPAESYISIKERVEKVSIITIDGKQVLYILTPNYQNNNTQINLTQIPSGVYFISFVFENMEYLYQFIKN